MDISTLRHYKHTMHQTNHFIDWLRSLFSVEPVDEPEDDEEEYPDADAVVELERVNEEITHTFERTIERTVTLVHFAQGGSLVVEHDEIEDDGKETAYLSVTDFEGNGHARSEAHCANLVYDNTVSTVNDMAVAHEENIGEIEVTVRRRGTLTLQYERLVTDDLPDDVVDDRGVPNARRNTIVRENGTELDPGWGRTGFEMFNGEIVYNRQYVFDSWDDDVTIETDREMGDVLGEAIAGRTEQMQAVSADGQVLLSDSQGTTADMVQVQSLPGGRE